MNYHADIVLNIKKKNSEDRKIPKVESVGDIYFFKVKFKEKRDMIKSYWYYQLRAQYRNKYELSYRVFRSFPEFLLIISCKSPPFSLAPQVLLLIPKLILANRFYSIIGLFKKHKETLDWRYNKLSNLSNTWILFATKHYSHFTVTTKDCFLYNDYEKIQ